MLPESGRLSFWSGIVAKIQPLRNARNASGPCAGWGTGSEAGESAYMHDLQMDFSTELLDRGFKYVSPSQPEGMYGPYFDTLVNELRETMAVP